MLRNSNLTARLDETAGFNESPRLLDATYCSVESRSMLLTTLRILPVNVQAMRVPVAQRIYEWRPQCGGMAARWILQNSHWIL